FPIRVPVERDGAVAYVLTAEMSAGGLATLVRAGGRDEWARAILDARGVIVARSRDAEQWVGRGTSDAIRAHLGRSGAIYQATSLEGVEAYVAHAPAALSGWSTVVLVPANAVAARARRSLLVASALGALVVLLSGGTAFWSAVRLSRSIGATVAGAHALATGARPRLRRSRVREVAELHAALERADALLEARARERDEHLARAERARADAEHASRAKDEFLAMLGHELRNPLSPIVTALELLRMRGHGGTREHAIIERQVRHVVRLVDDLLDVSRITRGALVLKREVVELSSVVSRSLEMVRPLLESRGHQLAVDVPPYGFAVVGDPDRLAQIVANLLTNAARYTPPRGHVRVAAASRGDEITISVSDDGQGISAELLPHVFDLFVQGARSSDRREGGLGLGLALVKSLVAAHGGRVEARSQGPGTGSTFTITLPRAPTVTTPLRDRASARLTPRPARRSRVLVVDDNVDAAAL
ncbi:MAG TPA: ATP-binding protein, partial [Anaeromyxobacteraceae bacterium]|nr:ATP-binding protein [Anaeromyxobacteraceae bacterium]